uniref:Reverse transcriptase domain-containing protein n=1 Tax=Megaselia scalaris TaxID=36166 RepID=T1H1S0_MEGSC
MHTTPNINADSNLTSADVRVQLSDPHSSWRYSLTFVLRDNCLDHSSLIRIRFRICNKEEKTPSTITEVGKAIERLKNYKNTGTDDIRLQYPRESHQTMTLRNTWSCVRAANGISLILQTMLGFRQGYALSCSIFYNLLETIVRAAKIKIFSKSTGVRTAFQGLSIESKSR